MIVASWVISNLANSFSQSRVKAENALSWLVSGSFSDAQAQAMDFDSPGFKRSGVARAGKGLTSGEGPPDWTRTG